MSSSGFIDHLGDEEVGKREKFVLPERVRRTVCGSVDTFFFASVVMTLRNVSLNKHKYIFTHKIILTKLSYERMYWSVLLQTKTFSAEVMVINLSTVLAFYYIYSINNFTSDFLT